jgi:thymidylate synthase (FAD)
MIPRLYLIGRPQFDRRYQEFLNDFLPKEDATWRRDENATPAEQAVEFAGRVCYMSFGSSQSIRTNKEYIENLIHHGHESVLEHAVWTIVIACVSRAFTHQLVRHRVGFAFSQLSQQYHDESNSRFVQPPEIDQVPEVAAVWEEAIRNAQSSYKSVLKKLESASSKSAGNRKESSRALRSAARSLLPNATEAAIVVTANARALRHFLKIRGDIVGDIEMRRVAAALLELIRPEGPALFSDFNISYLADGSPIVVHKPAT